MKREPINNYCAYEQGFGAAYREHFEGIESGGNPYKIGTLAHRDWNRGYDEDIEAAEVSFLEDETEQNKFERFNENER